MDEFKLFISENSDIIKIIGGALIFLVMFLLRNKLSTIILKLTGKVIFNKEDKEHKRKSLVDSLCKPFSALFVVIGIFVGLYINIPNKTVLGSFKIAVILVFCWGIVNYLSNNLFLLFHFGENADDKMNTTAIKFISNILKIVVISFAVLMIASELGYNVNGFITGLGVGGLAISLAAKDAVSNLISGFVIVFEKPFIVGEFIQTASIQGFVEEVTMRSTKIRTLEDSVVTVPNSKLTDDAIINISRTEKRLISIEFGVEYSTSNEKIEKCKNDVKQYLVKNNNICESPLRVYVSKLDDSAINISVTCYTKTPDLDKYLNILSKVNLKIKSIIEENGVEFAFPSKTVYLQNKQ